MKKQSLFLIAIVVVVAMALQSCTKAADTTVAPAGATGPKGDQGATGAAGARGPKGDPGATGAVGAQGATGNANVTQVTFNQPVAPSVAGRLFTFPAAITTAILNSSAVNVYIQTSNFPGVWYYIPGFISSNLDNFRTFVDATNRQISVIRQSGTEVSSITSTRVVIIPANNFINGRKANIDYSDYNAVKAAYNLPD